MQTEKCIPIKKKFIDYMSKWFPDFSFEGSNSQCYAFRRENPDGIYDHIIVQREFYKGMISLVVTEVASCYNKSWRGIPWFTVGHGTDIAVLITGKKIYDVNIGWHRCKNDAEELCGLFDKIRKDIDAYVIGFFAKCHKKINADKCMVITNSYMQAQFAELSEEDVNKVKEYMVNSNKAYSEYRKAYRKACKKSGVKETIPYVDPVPLHPIMEDWLTDIQERLNYACLSESMRTQLIKYITLLFRDNYDFYNLR